MAVRLFELEMMDQNRIPQLTARLAEIDKGITNITVAIEKGVISEALTERLGELEKERKILHRELKVEEKSSYRIDRDQIIFWLSQLRQGDIEDVAFRRRLIDLFINSVTVWDDPDGYRITTAYNINSCNTKTFRVEPDNDSGLSDAGDSGSTVTIQRVPAHDSRDPTRVSAVSVSKKPRR